MTDTQTAVCRNCRGSAQCPGCINGDGKMIDRYGYTVACDVCGGDGRCPECNAADGGAPYVAPNYAAAAAHNALMVVEFPDYSVQQDVQFGRLTLTLRAGWSFWSPSPYFFWNAVGKHSDTIIRFDGRLSDANFVDAWTLAYEELSAVVGKVQL